MNTHNLSRRVAIASMCAAVAVPVAVKAAPSSLDAELFELGRELEDANAQYVVAINRCSEAGDRYRALNPPSPLSRPQPPAKYAALYKTITVGEMRMLAQDHPLVLWERETFAEDSPFSKLSKARSDERHRLMIESGVEAAEEDVGDWQHTVWEIGSEILAMPARTITGTMVKLRAIEAMAIDFDDCAKTALDSLAADIRALAGAVQS